MTLTKKTTIQVDAVAALVEQFRAKVNLEALVGIFAKQAQDLENVNFELIDNRTLDVSEGPQLDGIGAIVDEPRNGRTDDDYREAIRTRILLNLSEGTIEDVIEIVDRLIPNVFEFIEFFPAAFVVLVSDALIQDPAALANTIAEARPVAVDASLQYTLTTDALTFSFASGDTAEASATQGFSNDGGTSGGKFADALAA